MQFYLVAECCHPVQTLKNLINNVYTVAKNNVNVYELTKSMYYNYDLEYIGNKCIHYFAEK
jgi:hypothetical protein